MTNHICLRCGYQWEGKTMKRWFDYNGNIGDLEISGTVSEEFFKRELKKMYAMALEKLMNGENFQINLSFDNNRIICLAERHREIMKKMEA